MFNSEVSPNVSFCQKLKFTFNFFKAEMVQHQEYSMDEPLDKSHNTKTGI